MNSTYAYPSFFKINNDRIQKFKPYFQVMIPDLINREIKSIKTKHSVEIPTICSFVIEFIIPKFTEGSTYFERHTARQQEL